jgi:hypothetical protein
MKTDFLKKSGPSGSSSMRYQLTKEKFDLDYKGESKERQKRLRKRKKQLEEIISFEQNSPGSYLAGNIGENISNDISPYQSSTLLNKNRNELGFLPTQKVIPSGFIPKKKSRI